MEFWEEFEETNENEGHPQIPFTATLASSKKKKKVLGDRNADDPPLTPQEKPLVGFGRLSSRIHSISDSSRSVPYDPVNNYTSPRPAFLRYNPDRRKEILLRMRDEEGSATDSGPSQNQDKSIDDDSLSVSSISPKPSSRDKETQEDAEADDYEDEEVEERRPLCFRTVWKLLVIFGIFLFSQLYLFPMNSSFSPFREKNSRTGKLLYRNLLKTHMGLGDVCCLDIGEEMCGIERPGVDLVVSDDSVMGLIGDSAKNEFLMSDEVYGELDSDEKSSIEDLMDGDDIQNVELLLIEEEREVTTVSSHESLEQEEILATETIEHLSRPFEAPADQFVSDDSHTYHEELIETNSREEAQFEESVELTESISCPLHDDQAAEESEFPIVNETSSKWKIGLKYASKEVQLLSLSLSLLAVIIGLFTGLFKYFARSHRKSFRGSSPSPIFLPSDKSVDERRISKDTDDDLNIQIPYSQNKQSLLVPCSLPEELRAEGKDSYVNPSHSSYSSDEIQGFYATRPPMVELLGEFSIVDALAAKVVSGQTLKSKGFEESEFSRSQARRTSSDDSRLSQSEKSRTVKIKSSPSSSKIHPYLAVESTSHGSFNTAGSSNTAQEKLVKKEDIIEKGESKKVLDTPTPLRRSSRLRNRVISPTP